MAETVGRGDDALRCPFCAYVATDREDYKTHILEAHPEMAD